METKNNKNEKQLVKGNQNDNSNNKGKKINTPEAGNGDNWGDDPEKKKEIGDNPSETERKIPRMKS